MISFTDKKCMFCVCVVLCCVVLRVSDLVCVCACVRACVFFFQEFSNQETWRQFQDMMNFVMDGVHLRKLNVCYGSTLPADGHGR